MLYTICGLIVSDAFVGQFEVVGDFAAIRDAFGGVISRHRAGEDPIVLACASLRRYTIGIS